MIGDSVTRIGQSAFWNCYNLANIVIPSSLSSTDDQAFAGCSNINTVYYKGSSSDWANIYFYSYGSNDVKNATRYYYSESKPTEEGNYWHWINGDPTVWE